jgi:hypothetical protein
MADKLYLVNRKKWARPQAILFSDGPAGTDLDNDFRLYQEQGYELTSDLEGIDPSVSEGNGFIILSDHNRAPLSISYQRLEQRTRMANGQLRSYFIADKMNLSLSWSMLPSRSFSNNPKFDQETGQPTNLGALDLEFTADGGAGGAEILAWYKNHPAPFWVYLSYDNYAEAGYDVTDYNKLSEYKQSVEMYITSFDFSVEKRGATNHDLWNLSLTLEEV